MSEKVGIHHSNRHVLLYFHKCLLRDSAPRNMSLYGIGVARVQGVSPHLYDSALWNFGSNKKRDSKSEIGR